VDAKGALVVAFSKITTPVGVPPLPVTVPVRFPDTNPAVPVIAAGLKLMVVAAPVLVAVVQLLSKFVTFTEPSPVAKS
jgi:hypothetical protein